MLANWLVGAALLLPLMFGVTEPAHAAKFSASEKRSVSAGKFDAGGVFGSLALGTNINLASKHWVGALHKMRLDAGLVASCLSSNTECRQGVKLFSRFIVGQKDKPADINLLAAVNRFVNDNIRYATDRRVFGRSEYWAGPSEVMGASGDCEDFVITKYFVLSTLGFGDRHMRVVVVRDLVTGFGHAVLAVNLAGRTLILDNRTSSVRDHMEISRYQPLYSMNRVNAWLNLAVERAPASAVLTTKRPASSERSKPVRVADLHAGIATHLARKKQLQHIGTAPTRMLGEVHY